MDKELHHQAVKRALGLGWSAAPLALPELVLITAMLFFGFTNPPKPPPL